MWTECRKSTAPSGGLLGGFGSTTTTPTSTFSSLASPAPSTYQPFGATAPTTTTAFGTPAATPSFGSAAPTTTGFGSTPSTGFGATPSFGSTFGAGGLGQPAAPSQGPSALLSFSMSNSYLT